MRIARDVAGAQTQFFPQPGAGSFKRVLGGTPRSTRERPQALVRRHVGGAGTQGPPPLQPTRRTSPPALRGDSSVGPRLARRDAVPRILARTPKSVEAEARVR